MMQNERSRRKTADFNYFSQNQDNSSQSHFRASSYTTAKSSPKSRVDDENAPPVHSLHDTNTSSYQHNNYKEAKQPGYEKESKEVWVTVFGFPPELHQHVLSEFNRTIQISSVQKVPNSNQVHILCESSKQAEAALQKNGTVIQGSMIGVITPKYTIYPDASFTAPPAKRKERRETQLPSYVSDPSKYEAKANRSLFSKVAEYIFGF